MFKIIYLKSSKKIQSVHYDQTTLDEKMSLDTYLLGFCNEIPPKNPNDYVAVVGTFDPALRLIVGNHVYNEATGQIEADPSYVEPPPPPRSPEQNSSV
jgi:hypothetical protein